MRLRKQSAICFVDDLFGRDNDVKGERGKSKELEAVGRKEREGEMGVFFGSTSWVRKRRERKVEKR